MNKKLIAGIVIAAAVVCCGGGYVAMQNEKKVKQENVQISEMLDKLPDITVKEGESLPDLKNNIEDTSMIEPDTLKVDIQNVDITVPGTYDVVYSFKDIHGNERSKTVQCKVEANLLDHVYGMDDIETDCGKELPKDETTFDEEYVSSVTRDDSEVDIDTPGTYNITYTVLGTDGSMEEADRLAKVLETGSGRDSGNTCPDRRDYSGNRKRGTDRTGNRKDRRQHKCDRMDHCRTDSRSCRYRSCPLQDAWKKTQKKLIFFKGFPRGVLFFVSKS